MPNALLTGVSGLISHQRMLEVVGNNLANLNTTGFKAQRTLFSDLIYSTIRPAGDSESENIGGTNPNQIGSGVKIAQIVHNFSQGNLQSTGGLFDYALQGDGFFMVNNGNQNYFTRAGSFSLDDDNRLTDPATGYRVQRFGTIGEAQGVEPGFQTAGDSGIVVPIGTAIPGQKSTQLQLSGNLNANLTGPKAEVLTSQNPFQTGGGVAAAVLTTPLNSLDTNVTPYGLGDLIFISGTDVDGTTVNTTLAVNPGTTLGEIVTAVDGLFTGATASLDTLGNLVLTADNAGEAFLTLSISDDPGNAGFTSFSNHDDITTTEGKDADTFDTTVELIDIQGTARKVNLTFEKQSTSVWNLTASIAPSDGTIIDGSIQQIQFSETGSFQNVLGTGLGDARLIMQFSGVSSPQTIDVSFGGNAQVGAISHLALDSSVDYNHDGFPPGILNHVNVTADGVIEGFASNGRRFAVAQLAIAKFANPLGLEGEGDNYFVASLGAGDPQIGTALSGGRGSIIGSQLEQSNVDIAFEFTRLIVAQKGFSANARTITVADEVLDEVTNLVR